MMRNVLFLLFATAFGCRQAPSPPAHHQVAEDKPATAPEPPPAPVGPPARAEPEPAKNLVNTIEIAGMGLTWTQDRYLAKFAAEGMKCRNSKYVVSRLAGAGWNTYYEKSKASLPVTLCWVDCKDGSGKTARLVGIYEGIPYKVTFRPCASTSITLGVAAATFAAKLGSTVQVRAKAFSVGALSEVDGFAIALDRGLISAHDGVSAYLAGADPATKPLDTIEWVDSVRRREMDAKINDADIHGPARQAAKKVDL